MLIADMFSSLQSSTTSLRWLLLGTNCDAALFWLPMAFCDCRSLGSRSLGFSILQGSEFSSSHIVMTPSGSR